MNSAEKQHPSPAHVRAWLFDAAAPLWLDAGVDGAQGGFHEALHFDATPSDPGFRRTRVAGRQIYVYAHAAILGWPSGLDAAHAAARRMAALHWRDGAGFIRRAAPDGAILDPAIDLYDNAFAVLAFAWLYRATGDKWALEWAHRTLATVTRFLAQPIAGCWSDEARAPPLQQNPHMHLLEACLAACDAAPEDDAFRVAADDLIALFKAHLFDGATIAELFDADWRRTPAVQVEPGHLFEWAWILAQHGRIAQVDHRETIRTLIDFGLAHGVDSRTGLVVASVDAAGRITDPQRRTWRNTELVKAIVAARDLGIAIAGADLDAAVATLFTHFLNAPVRGGWIDSFDADGAATAKDMPASTFYHVFLALAEYLRSAEIPGNAG